MCTYLTEKIEVAGSGKGAAGWFALSDATVYFDHPQHARPSTRSTSISSTPGRALARGWRSS